MPGPDPAVAAIRYAVRSTLADLDPGSVVLAAVSGGPDSTALAAALAHEASEPGWLAGAVVVDHGLQEGSAQVAERAAATCRALGLEPVRVVRVTVDPGREGLESAARAARYAALDAAATDLGATAVLLGHTLDDQAEQVLLGLARGSGARSLSGMPPARGRYRRPLLGITRAQTRQACAAESLAVWDDPMNADDRHLRVRVRRALADLEHDLGPGLAASLARTADQLREDADLLDALAVEALATLALDPIQGSGGTEVAAADLASLPRPVRTRVWRRLLISAGAPAGQVTTRHTEACDALVTDWHGQGPVHAPGGVRVDRRAGRLRVDRDRGVE